MSNAIENVLHIIKADGERILVDEQKMLWSRASIYPVDLLEVGDSLEAHGAKTFITGARYAAAGKNGKKFDWEFRTRRRGDKMLVTRVK